MKTRSQPWAGQHGIRIGAAAATLLVLFPLLAQSIPDLGFTTRVSALLKSQFAQKFGAPAADRLDTWIGFARTQGQPRDRDSRPKPAQETDLLRSVNAFFNRVKYVEDTVHWGQDDYWASPAEMVSSAGADCEDYAIAKYYLLKELGVPISKLRITYVKALKLKQAHMVLAYYPKLGEEPLILDNLEQTIRPASERDDLDPAYAFNDDEVELTKTGQKTVPAQIRAWASLQARLRTQSRT